jgi:hypothetical protein
MENRFLTLLSGQVQPQLPLLLVWVAGVILAVVFWRKHPLPALLTLVAMLLLLLQFVFGTLAYAWILSQESSTTKERGMMLMALSGVRSLASAMACGLLLGAVFGWRKPAVGGSKAAAVDVVEPPPETGIQRDPER